MIRPISNKGNHHVSERKRVQLNPESPILKQSIRISQSEGEVFGEAELMALTAELLEITNEEELNHFLGNLVKRAAGAIGKVVRSP